ncbi:6ef31e3a-3dac-404c-b6cd-e3a455a14ec9 [Sclerotinia trifoliorum]|uniref:6ef31e3a-3dac-404c-b6cd-e3a455a14ec9 n=1 Tax=Sclerotinia trifoliorum TaxID=28548 RepID=A0A8H2VMC7_9HELO|nr:6ef31e3a-3dac-404c-b6cd-e3a455a14ec9 [Sclerotinia trifoliorum]
MAFTSIFNQAKIGARRVTTGRMLKSRLHDAQVNGKCTAEARTSYLTHLYTIWLFTFSDLKTVVGPESAFGILSALSGPILTSNEFPNTVEIVCRLPTVVFWAWINLLPLVIDNQRRPYSIGEDRLNKPWRPMPTGRISATVAKRWMQAFYCVAIISSFYTGTIAQCTGLIILAVLYNEVGGADKSCVVRNLLNALGFLCYGSGTTLIASDASLSNNGVKWFVVIGSVMFTTVHAQDMSDQAGDKARGRKSVPLVIGDWPARLTIAVFVGFWSFFCPAFWHLSIYGYLAPIMFGAVVITRCIRKRGVDDDKVTFWIWNVWVVMLYLLPLCKRLGF